MTEPVVTQEKIDRINELYRKSKAEGLTEAEKQEQELLRKEYIANVRMNLRAHLNSIDVVNEDGSVDYKELNTISHIQAGQLLARLHKEDPGQSGRNVFGEEI